MKWLFLPLAPPCATLPLNKGTIRCCLVGSYTVRLARRTTPNALVTRHARAPDLPVGRRSDHIATRAIEVPPTPVGVSGPLDRFDRGGETVDHTT